MATDTILYSAIIVNMLQLISAIVGHAEYRYGPTIYDVALVGFEHVPWKRSMSLGLVFIKDREGHIFRLCNNDVTQFQVNLLCKMLGYSGGWERYSQWDKKRYNSYKSYRTAKMECQGTEMALDECTLKETWQKCHSYAKAVELLCTNPVNDPDVPCGRDLGIVTAAKNNRWSLNYSVAIELEELTGVKETSLETSRMLQRRTVQPSTITSAVEFPWTAKLNFWNHITKEWEYRCGAAIITDRIVLTLASCVERIGYYSVTIGDFDTEVRNGLEETFEVQNDFPHPKFREDKENNNIAIVVLKKKGNSGIKFRSPALPVCLPVERLPLEYRMRDAVVAAWGKQVTSEAATISRFLTIANVKLFHKSDCEGHTEFRPSIICAGNMEGGSDACLFDQGAPLIAKIQGRSLLVGLMAEPGCGVAGKPSKYVSIQYHLDWIKSKVAELHAVFRQIEQYVEEESEEEEEEEDDSWQYEKKK